MKKVLLCFMAVTAVTILFSCQQKDPTRCHIVGTVNGEQYEGKRIFLVPLTGPATAETVDSMEITNGKFEFFPDSMQMYKILLDYHYRMGLQPLIIVGEPGEIKITIDSISHATGTPQNDSLEQWKIRTEVHNRQYAQMRRDIDKMESVDSVKAKYMKQYADSFHLDYKNYTRQMAKHLEGSVLGDFLKSLYPLTYQRQMPDGRIVTMNSDTNEEISE